MVAKPAAEYQGAEYQGAEYQGRRARGLPGGSVPRENGDRARSLAAFRGQSVIGFLIRHLLDFAQ